MGAIEHGTAGQAAQRAGNSGRSRIILSGTASLETPAERALDRVLRSGQPASVLRLYLSRLGSTGPRSYHCRIARCLFDDAVQGGGGQVFACRNSDLVLIAGPEAVASLGVVLLRLFRSEAPVDRQLLGLWSLPADDASVRAGFAVSPEDSPPPEELPAPLGAIAAITTVLTLAEAGDFVRRQTAVQITASRMTSLFEELSVSLPAIEARAGIPVPAGADPYLFRYVASQIDARMLRALAGSGLASTAALNMNLPLSVLSTPEFAAVRLAARTARILLGVEISLAEAMADMPLFQATRARLQQDGCSVVLDALDHHALLQCDPAALGADMVKLEWSPSITALPMREQRRIRHALDAIGRDQIVVYRAETEAALVWGLAQGIARFQGRHVDLMLAADRIRGCSHSAACSLRQCIDRAAATNEGGRRGCVDPVQLLGHLPWTQTQAEAFV